MAVNEQSQSRAPVILAVGAVAMIVVIVLFYFLNRITPAPAQPIQKPLAMGAVEQAYVPSIQFLEPKVGRAANFLNQEITFVFGTVLNNGSRNIKQIEIQLEFHDVFQQVVLRDKQRLFGENAVPLAPQAQRDFQLGYETMPAQWNQAYPTIRIIGLDLE
jgi:hypothetical protein